MARAGAGALRRELGGDPPPGIAALSDAQLGELAGAIHAAQRRQAAELQAAGDKALGLIPRVLRIPIKRMFG